MLAGILAGPSYAANGQDAPGDCQAGRVDARQVCALCQHARDDGDRASRLLTDIASVDAENLILTPEQSDDVMAFLLSLRDHRQPKAKP